MVPFDPSALRVTGDPTPIQVDVPSEFLAASHAAFLAGSTSGLFAFVAGEAGNDEGNLLLVDRGGASRRLGDGTGERPRFSPDGKSIVAESNGELWIFDLARGGVRTRFVRPGMNFAAMWSADGKRIVSSSYANRGGPAQLLSVRVADAADVRELSPSHQRRYASSYLRDGSAMAFVEMGATSANAYVLKADRTVAPLVATDADEGHPRFSPNGRWVAFTSTQSGAAEVYLQGYPVPGRPVKVSVGGGREPVWNANGIELLYRRDDHIMAVAVTYGSEIAIGAPREVARVPGMLESDITTFQYDLSPDGRTIVAALRAPPPKTRELHVVTGLSMIGKP